MQTTAAGQTRIFEAAAFVRTGVMIEVFVLRKAVIAASRVGAAALRTGPIAAARVGGGPFNAGSRYGRSIGRIGRRLSANDAGAEDSPRKAVRLNKAQDPKEVFHSWQSLPPKSFPVAEATRVPFESTLFYRPKNRHDVKIPRYEHFLPDRQTPSSLQKPQSR